jgi:hypothetical protein
MVAVPRAPNTIDWYEASIAIQAAIPAKDTHLAPTKATRIQLPRQTRWPCTAPSMARRITSSRRSPGGVAA